MILFCSFQFPESLQTDCGHHQTLLRWSLNLRGGVHHRLRIILLLLLLRAQHQTEELLRHHPHRGEHHRHVHWKVQLRQSQSRQRNGGLDFLRFLK